MRTELFDFDLPEGLIALRPAQPRESARLLQVARDGSRSHWRVGDLPSLLAPGDLLIVNDTWVVRGALKGVRASRAENGAPVALAANLIERASPSSWLALVRPAKRLRVGDRVRFGADGRLEAEVAERNEGAVRLAFSLHGEALDQAIEAAGAAPLPPYIASRRAADAQDFSDYQTVYADRAIPERSVAAPTAGLHLTLELLAALREKRVEIAQITLGVGAGTFLPVKTEDTADHPMHSEQFRIGEAAAEAYNRARARGSRIVAVGTTALRALESADWEESRLLPTQKGTDLFITPGYRFRSIDGVLTNFHLPRSTLFMLVCALQSVEAMQAAYAEAIRERYRFYSYGDACLIWRANG